MPFRKIFCYILMFFSCSCPAFAETRICDNWELQQELNIIKQELDKNENVLKTSTPELLQQKISDVLREVQSQKNRIMAIENELRSSNSQQGFLKNINSNPFPVQNSLSSTNISNFSGSSSDDYRKQLDFASNTIVNQTKQLSKAYSEIESLKRGTLTTDRFIDNMINQAERLRSQGKTQEAVAIYEALDRLDIRKPKVYQNLASLYQSMGRNSEAQKQYNKLNTISPNFNIKY